MGKRIVAVTGARSEYDLLSTVYRQLQDDDFFDFSLIVTGSHLSESFGKTVKFIEKDGFPITDKIYNLVDSDDRIGRIISIGNQINGLAQALNRINPDIVLVAGDREEAITVTLTCAYMDIAVAHFFGGDIAKDGNIDNSVRYAASKFAHIHFPSLAQHKETLLKLGEPEDKIFVVGNPALDKFLSIPKISINELSKKLDFKLADDERYLMLIQHSIITEVELQATHIRETLNAIVKSGLKCFLNYPNSDAGHFAIIEAYNEYCIKSPKQFKLFQNLDRNTYVNLMRHASCLLGNSSSGILEAPSLGLPVINIGNRQKGRIHGNNVTFVDNNKDQIFTALQRILSDEEFVAKIKASPNPYGDGKTSVKIVNILKEIEIDNNLIYKNITY